MKACRLCNGASQYSGINPPNLTVLRCRQCGFSYLAVADDEIARANECGAEQESLYQQMQSAFDRAYFRVLVRRLCPSGGRLLDVGCGNGMLLGEAYRLGLAVEGMDPSPWAQGRPWRVHRSWRDCPRVAYDVVTCTSVLEHVPYPVEFVAECLLRLRPGGVACFTVPNYAGLESLGIPTLLRPQHWPYHCNFFRPRDLRRIAALVGGTCSVRAYGIPHAWTVWRWLRFRRKRPTSGPSCPVPTWKHRLAVALYDWGGRVLGSKLEMIIAIKSGA